MMIFYVIRTLEDAARALSLLITASEAQLQRQLQRTSTPARGGTGYITPLSISALSQLPPKLYVDNIRRS